MKKLCFILCGLCLAFALLTDAGAQTITNQPQSLTINYASTAAFKVGASGATNYQWQFNGTNLSDGGNISGSTNSTLTLEDVAANQAGSYTVVINGSVTSSNAVLTLLPGTLVTFTLSGFIGGGQSNVDVQLFNHDKPLTVQNFLHYINSGAFSNMFFQRCVPNFVIQGGGYGAVNQTNTNPPIAGWNINTLFTDATNQEPPFPAAINSEFNVGPLVRNRFGTMAMALGANANSANSQFFFNLADNSPYLDTNTGGFTVFGRILDGTNVLQYFNTLSNGAGIYTGATFLPSAYNTVPVNYVGTNAPANANLVFCAFALTQPAGATNSPGVVITSPSANVVLNSGLPLNVQGTATDNNNIGLASVRCDLIPLAAADGTLPNGGVSLTNYILGSNIWSVHFGVVPPGMYELGAQVEDEAGNLSPEVFIQPLIVSPIFTNGNGTVTFSQGAYSNLDAVGYPFQTTSNYSLMATASANQLFVDWTSGNEVVLIPDLLFSPTNDLLWTATFVSNGIPNGLAITQPEPGATLSNSTFNISGTISNVPSPPVTVTCQLYSATTDLAVGPPLTSDGAPNWSVTASGIANGSYAVEVTAVDASNNITVASEDFSVSAPAAIVTEPASITVNYASSATFTVGATNAAAYQWQFQGTNIAGATNSSLLLEDVMTNEEGSYTVIVSSSINSVTSAPPAVLTVVPGTIVTFTFSGLLTNAPGSNVDVQLFDHDKPVTVENFLHYIRAGGYSNMFFDRCIPGFVLQGGDYGTVDRTNMAPPLIGWDISTMFAIASNRPDPPFPEEIDNEFNVGPVIHNRFGTIAMALDQGEPNSASSAFFFNLADNSGAPNYLDSQDFTVFGRILDGTNVLQYFNTLTNKEGLVTNGLLFDEALQVTNRSVTNLPVNYRGTNAPANSNLVFCDFNIGGSPPVDTNSPALTVTYPLPNTLFSNGNPVIQGTASNDVGLPIVICVLIPQAAADGTYPNGGVPITNFAVGTSNWSVTCSNSADGQGLVPPGNYILSVQAQNGAGYLSPATNEPLIITAIVTNGFGTVTFTQGAFTNLNAVGYPFQLGSNYSLSATADANNFFVNWTADGYNSIDPGVSFQMFDGLLATANFISNSVALGIAFTYPGPNAVISTNEFNINGTISNDPATPVTITCQIYSASDYTAVGLPFTTSGITEWTEPATNLAVGSYIIEATAVDQDGNTTLITNTITVSTYASLQLNIVGPGTVSGATNGEQIFVGTTFVATAVPNSGQSFYSWSNIDGISLDPVLTNTMEPGLALTATFFTNNDSNLIAFTYPAANSIIGPGTLYISGTIAGAPTVTVTVTCQIFSATTSLAVSQPLRTTGTRTWIVALNGLGVGSYTIVATGVDPAGDSTLISENFSISTNVPLALNIVGPGTVSGATNGELITIGTTFQVAATPNPGQLFYAWSSNGAATSLNPVQTYTMTSGLTLTAVFVTNNNTNLIAFSYPGSNGIIGTNNFSVTGTISNVSSAEVTAQIFSATNLLAVTPLLESSGTTDWSITESGLGVGSYILVATGLGPEGESTLISEDFSVQLSGNLTLIILGTGTVAPVTNGESLPLGTNFQVMATPGPGEVFYTWNNGTQLFTNATESFTMAYGLTLTATFIPSNTAKGISFTYPPANAVLSTNNFVLKGRIASSMKSAQITCQFFQTNGVGVGSPLTTSGTNTWAVGVTNLPGGYYIVEAQATNSEGKSTIISEEFVILPFAAVQGSYSGLFICTNSPVSPTNSGFLTFTLNARGLMNGKMEFPAYAPIPIYSLPFENVDFTLGFAQFSSTNIHGQSLFGAIYLDLTDGTDVAYGTVSSDTWSSQLYCYRAVKTLSASTTPAPGKYVLSLQPGDQTNGPNTNGYASLVVAKNGTMSLSGELPDNTKFSQSAAVSKGGIWPLYAIPSGVKTNGVLLGWEIFSNTGSSDGRLYWYKGSHIGSYYTNGVGILSNMDVTAVGTNFSPPAGGSMYSIVFEGGTIVVPMTNTLQVSTAGQFVLAGGPADKLKMSLSANGVITGSLVNTNDNKTLKFYGAFGSPSQGGSGFIPDTGGQTGSFELHQ